MTDDEQPLLSTPQTISYWGAFKDIFTLGACIIVTRFILVGGQIFNFGLLASQSKVISEASAYYTLFNILAINTTSAMMFVVGMQNKQYIGEAKKIINDQDEISDWENLSQQKYQSIGSNFRNGYYLAGILAVLGSGLTFLGGPILRLFGQDQAHIKLVEDFFFPYGPIYIFSTLLIANVQQLLFSTEKPWHTLPIVLLGVGLASALNYVFTYFVSSPWVNGVRSLSLAYSIAWLIIFVLSKIYIHRQPDYQNKFGINGNIYRNVALGEVWELLKWGVPLGMRVFSEALSLFLASSFAGRLGNDPLEAENIANQHYAFEAVTINCIASAIGFVVAEKLELHYGNLGIATQTGLIIQLAYTSIFTLLSFIIPTKIMWPRPNNAGAAKDASQLLGINACMEMVDGVRMVFGSTLAAIKDVDFAMAVNIFFLGVVASLASYFFRESLVGITVSRIPAICASLLFIMGAYFYRAYKKDSQDTLSVLMTPVKARFFQCTEKLKQRFELESPQKVELN